MGDRKGNLYLYEAIELRNEYDRHIGLLQGLLGEPSKRRGIFNNDDEDKEPVTDFDPKEAEEKLKKLQRSAYRRFYLRPKQIISLLFRIRGLKQLLFIVKRAIVYS